MKICNTVNIIINGNDRIESNEVGTKIAIDTIYALKAIHPGDVLFQPTNAKGNKNNQLTIPNINIIVYARTINGNAKTVSIVSISPTNLANKAYKTHQSERISAIPSFEKDK